MDLGSSSPSSFSLELRRQEGFFRRSAQAASASSGFEDRPIISRVAANATERTFDGTELPSFLWAHSIFSPADRAAVGLFGRPAERPNGCSAIQPNGRTTVWPAFGRLFFVLLYCWVC